MSLSTTTTRSLLLLPEANNNDSSVKRVTVVAERVLVAFGETYVVLEK